MKQLICAVVLFMPWTGEARNVRSFDRTFDARGLERLFVEIPVGELRIEGGAGDRVEVEVTIECNLRKSRCREEAEDVDLVARERGNKLILEIDGLRKWKSLGMAFEIHMKAPDSMELEVDLGVGTVQIEGFENDVTVDQGVGELTVVMAEERVDSVDIDAGIGEASMRYRGGRLQTSGLFSNDLRWDDGSGSAVVRLDLGVGEVDLRLR